MSKTQHVFVDSVGDLYLWFPQTTMKRVCDKASIERLYRVACDCLSFLTDGEGKLIGHICDWSFELGYHTTGYSELVMVCGSDVLIDINVRSDALYQLLSEIITISGKPLLDTGLRTVTRNMYDDIIVKYQYAYSVSMEYVVGASVFPRATRLDVDANGNLEFNDQKVRVVYDGQPESVDTNASLYIDDADEPVIVVPSYIWQWMIRMFSSEARNHTISLNTLLAVGKPVSAPVPADPAPVAPTLGKRTISQLD